MVGFFARDEDSGQADSDAVNVAELIGCVSIRFGFPNDQALHGHPLFSVGLGYYQLHEVVNSAWLMECKCSEIL